MSTAEPAEPTPIQYGEGCAFGLGALLLAWIPLEGAWGWLRTGVFTVPEGQASRLLLDAAHSVPKQLVVWLIVTRLLRGHFDLRSTLLAVVVAFGIAALRNRFPIAPWRKGGRASAQDGAL